MIRFPHWPGIATSGDFLAAFAKIPNIARQSAAARKRASNGQPLLDHLISSAEQFEGNRKAQSLRGLEVDDHLDFCGPLNRQIARLLTLEDTTGVDAAQTV